MKNTHDVKISGKELHIYTTLVGCRVKNMFLKVDSIVHRGVAGWHSCFVFSVKTWIRRQAGLTGFCGFNPQPNEFIFKF
jgi:hypothetical protein